MTDDASTLPEHRELLDGADQITTQDPFHVWYGMRWRPSPAEKKEQS